MWNIDSTNRLIKEMSQSTETGELVGLFFDHVRRSAHERRRAEALMIETQRHMCTYIQVRKGL